MNKYERNLLAYLEKCVAAQKEERTMKQTNSYAEQIPSYDDIPKAVLGAIALSFAMRIADDDWEEAKRQLITEWDILHNENNGIVPQAVPAKLRKFISRD